MTSAINTNNLDVNYPVPGQNNSSQGFRNNFSTIRTNLDTAASEITDLQSKVIVKSALDGSTLDNNMNNALITNALTRGFRSVIKNIGTNLSGQVTINVAEADVFTGTVTGNTVVNFINWPPTNTEARIQLDLNVTNPLATITFPAAVKTTDNWGAQTLENVSIAAGVATVTVPFGVNRLQYELVTQDCGTTVSIEPTNRSRQANQLSATARTPVNIGEPGDRAGTTCWDANYLYVCVGNYDGTTQIWRRIALTTY